MGPDPIKNQMIQPETTTTTTMTMTATTTAATIAKSTDETIELQNCKKQEVPQNCPLEECLKFLAGAWTPQIIWFLHQGPRRFGELRRDLGGISSKVLTQRLREMEKQGVVNRKVLETYPPQVEYSITELGREFGPVFKSMVEVAKKLKKHH